MQLDTPSPLRRAVGLLLVVLIATVLQISQRHVHAQTEQPSNEFQVNSTEDKVDTELADDICDADPGPAVQCTLRAAIIQANVTSGQQVIRLQPLVYRLTIPGAGEDNSFTGDLDITDDVQIIGTSSGKARSTIDATDLNDRVFDGRLFSSSGQWLLQQLTVTGGQLPSTTGLSDDFNGGGIRNFSNLTISDSVIRNNTAARGGGIAQNTQKVVIERSLISDNRAIAGDTGSFADGGGGILQINARLVLRDSTVQNNTSFSQGGGLSLLPIALADTSARIERSLIVGNSAQINGGGISVEGKNKGKVVIENSTVSANFATTRGGGIATQNVEIPVVLRAVTIAGNRSQRGGGVINDQGSSDAKIEVTNSIFANNVGGNCFFERYENSSFNLSSDSFCFFEGTNNQKSVGARLGPLAFNGGPTRTHALLEGSPAINAGAPRGICPILDQRGLLRPVNILTLNDPCDSGAFDLIAFGVGAFTLNPTSATVTAEQPTKLAVTWTHPERWRDLNTVDVQLRHEEAMPLWVRFTEGLTETQGISVTNSLALYNSDGTLAGVGEPGQALILESDTATLDLAQSQVQGSGAEGKEVTLALAVRLKEAAAGQRYAVTLLAGDDDGTVQGPNEAGTLAVGPFKVFVPLVIR